MVPKKPRTSGYFGCLIIVFVIFLMPFLILGGKYVIDDIRASRSANNQLIKATQKDIQLPRPSAEVWNGAGMAPQGYEVTWRNPRPSTSASFYYTDSQSFGEIRKNIEESSFIALKQTNTDLSFSYAKEMKSGRIVCIEASRSVIQITIEENCDDGKLAIINPAVM